MNIATGSSLAVFTSVALAHLLAVMSPGPDFAMVTRQTLHYGRVAGLWTAWGIATGILYHICYGLFGLSWLLDRYPQMLEVMRFAGAAFLIYMGIGALRARPRDERAMGDAAGNKVDPRRHFGIGVVTNVLNPKATLSFTALFTAVIATHTPMPLRYALAAWFIASTAIWFSFVALTLGHARVRAALIRNGHWIDRLTGAILIALGLGLLWVGL
jgi:threonine/homoserine/homoserine lactone efflux protein